MTAHFNKKKVRKLMNEKGFRTQVDLADELGITKNQLSVILADSFNPLKGSVQKLIDTLGEEVLGTIETDEEEAQSEQTFLNLDDSTKFPDGFLDISEVRPRRKFTNLELFAGQADLL